MNWASNSACIAIVTLSLNTALHVWFPLSLSEPPGLSLRLEQREDVALPHGTLHVADEGRASLMYAFIKPPSMEVLGARLRGRKTEEEEEEALKVDTWTSNTIYS